MTASGTGLRIGPYEVIEHVATGRLAEVLIARIAEGPRAGERVALKRILARFAKDPEVRSAIVESVVATSREVGRGGTRVEGVSEVDGELVVEMELLDGVCLATLLDRGRALGVTPTIGEVVHVMSELAETLLRLHRATGPDGAPLVHGGLGPAAVFVTSAGETKLLELGVERAISVLDPDTRSGLIGQRAQYLSPEQIGFRMIDAKADVWALGATAWELVAGHGPFAAETLLETLDRVRAAEVARVSRERADVPAALDVLIAQMLAREAIDRPSIAEVLARLRGAIAAEVREPVSDLRGLVGRSGLHVIAADAAPMVPSAIEHDAAPRGDDATRPVGAPSFEPAAHDGVTPPDARPVATLRAPTPSAGHAVASSRAPTPAAGHPVATLRAPTPSTGLRVGPLGPPTPSAGLPFGRALAQTSGGRSATMVVGHANANAERVRFRARMGRDVLAVVLGGALGWAVVEIVLRWVGR